MRSILILLALPVLAAAAPADSVPPDMQQAVVAYFGPTMVYPQTALWQFDTAKPYLLGGTVVCGAVNYQNSMRKFIGLKPFYAVLKDGRVKDGGMKTNNRMLDPEGSMDFSYDQHCPK